jgi:hypothetical protein
MTSPHTQITNGVATAINGGTWSRPVTAVTSFADWAEALEDLGTLHCDVVGAAKPTAELETPSSLEHSVPVTVGLRYRADPTDRGGDGRIKTSVLQGLVDLLYELAEWFVPGGTRTGRPLTSVTDAAMDPIKPVEIVYAYNPKHLLDLGQYTGLFRLRFLVSRAVT